MAITKEEVLHRLEQIYPDRIIYKETYTTKTIGMPYHVTIHSFAKSSDQSDKQWLQENGFSWKETGYSEGDMRFHDYQINRENAVALADSIMRCFPLIGQYTPSLEEKKLLDDYAQSAFQKLCKKNSVLSKADELVLTLNTVQFLKNWSTDSNEENYGNGFWNYIYLQYGFKEDFDDANQSIYRKFRDAIKNTLTHYKRYFSSEKTNRYYTSLLLHAISPIHSIEHLFDILFEFYVENLEFQYVAEDTVYKTLVKGIQARWEDSARSEASIKLKSSAVMSGLKALFIERPCYMAVLCDELVMKMDKLVRGEYVEDNNRWDSLLQEWYKKKSSIERGHLQRQKREQRTEFVATSSDRIYIQYLIEENKVGLVVPRIRLSEIGDSRPTLTLYQGNREIYNTELSLLGKVQNISKTDLSLTTRRTFIPLENTDIDFGEDMQLCGEIEYMDKTIYSSGTRLFRNHISFDVSGNERTVNNGVLYLFTSDNHEVDFSDEDGVYMEDHAGQLYRINLDLVDSITLDGTEIFVDEKQSGKVRLYPSIRPQKNICIKNAGISYHIFEDAFQVRLILPADENPLKYQVIIDGKREFSCNDSDLETEQLFRVQMESKCFHSIRVIDIQQNFVVSEYNYIILPAFRYSLDKEYYLETEDSAVLSIFSADAQIHVDALRIPGTNTASAISPTSNLDYEFDLPSLSCRFSEESAFELSPNTWHKDLENKGFIRIEAPEGCQVKLMLGTTVVPEVSAGCFEIGNYLRSGKNFGATELLWLSVSNQQGKNEQHLLSNLYFVPNFTESPLSIEDDGIFWLPEGVFMGDAAADFIVDISGKKEFSFETRLVNTQFTPTEALPHGCYKCKIFQKEEGLFAKNSKKLIYETDLVFGNENEFRFDNYEIVLTSAIYWDFSKEELVTMPMKPTAGILERLEYWGDSIPSGESVTLPEYDAALLFETLEGRRIYFNNNENKQEYEYINPARVWVVNENRLILRTVTDDAVYFDTKLGSIVNRNPMLTMSSEEQKKRLQNPDYFEYELRKV